MPGRRAWPRGVATAKAVSAGTKRVSAGSAESLLVTTPTASDESAPSAREPKTEAKNKLRALLRDHDDGLPTQRAYTVGDAVETWLVHGLVGRDPNTVANRTSLAQTHVIPGLGKRRLAELTAAEIDRWLADKATTLSTDTLQRLLSILRQSIRRAQARDLVKRNVALLCDLPKGQPGRPSKSLTREQAERLLRAAGDNPTMNAYVVVPLLTGARTEELRALTWSRVNLDGNRRPSTSGDLSEHTATRKRASHAAHSSCRPAASKP